MRILIILLISFSSLFSEEFSGVIKDFETLKPVDSARVVFPSKELEQFTDTNGHFRFNLDAGKYHIDIIKSGYEELHLNIDISEDIRNTEILITPLVFRSNEIEILSEKSTDRKIQKNIIARNINVDFSDLISKEISAGNSGYGAAVSRPVINGLSGNKLKIIEDGFELKDLSGNSSDHSTTINLKSLERIEILSGPEVLKSTSAVFGKILEISRGYELDNLPLETSFRNSSYFNSFNNGAGISTDGVISLESLSFNVDGLYENTGNIKSPNKTLQNTEFVTRDFGSSINFETGEWLFSLNGNLFRKNYGLPGGFVGSHPNGVDIEMIKNSLSFSVSHHLHGSFLEEAELDISRYFYDHREFEYNGNLGAQFRFQSYTAKLNFNQHEGDLFKGGSFGLSLETKKNQLGGLVFIPDSDYLTVSSYIIESLDLDNLIINLGARYDNLTVTPAQQTQTNVGLIRNRKFGFFSASSELKYLFDNSEISITVSKANRAPEPEELFSQGPHLAAYSFEVGNPNLEREEGLTYSLNYAGEVSDFDFNIETFYYDMSNYIVTQNTGDTNYTTLLPIFQFEGVEATLYGFNFGFSGNIIEEIFFSLNSSYTIGNNSETNSPLPFIPPAKANIKTSYKKNNWYFEVNSEIAASQTLLGEFEEATEGYFVIGLKVTKDFFFLNNLSQISFSLDNIFNSVYRNHLSRIKSIMPQPGRNFSLSFNYYIE